MLLAMLLSGCWDRRELEEKSSSLATGVDVCAEGEADCELVVTRQIAIPGRIPLGGGGGQGAGAPEDTVVIIRSPARDAPDSARHAQSQLNRLLFFGHTRVLVFSEAYARRGLEEFIDYVRRHPEARRLMWIGITEGPAEALMRARPRLEMVPALYLSDQFDDAVKTGRLPNVFLGEFLVRIANAGEEAVAPLIRMLGPDRPQFAGLAVFRGYRMVGKLTPGETVTFMELRGGRRGSELLHLDLGGGRQADLRVFNREVQYRLDWVDGRIQTDVRLALESELVALSPDLSAADPRTLDTIEELAAAEVARRAHALVEKLQREFGADILGLGERVRAYLPAVWRHIADWPEAFREVRFRITTTVYVRRFGMSVN